MTRWVPRKHWPLSTDSLSHLGPISRKSRNFSGVFRVTQFSLYLQNEGVSRHETLQLFLFLFPLQHMKRPALQNKQVIVLRLAFRARKVLGTFEKRAPGPWTLTRLHGLRWKATKSIEIKTFLPKLHQGGSLNWKVLLACQPRVTANSCTSPSFTTAFRKWELIDKNRVPRKPE